MMIVGVTGASCQLRAANWHPPSQDHVYQADSLAEVCAVLHICMYPASYVNMLIFVDHNAVHFLGEYYSFQIFRVFGRWFGSVTICTYMWVFVCLSMCLRVFVCVSISDRPLACVTPSCIREVNHFHSFFPLCVSVCILMVVSTDDESLFPVRIRQGVIMVR